MTQKIKGFTLIELLIVIGILAILATVVVLYLNPAQLLAESRDSQRLSDMESVRNAINIYLGSTATILFPQTGTGNCTDVALPEYWTSVAGGPNPFLAGKTENASHSFGVDGTGWVPIDLTQISGGSPLPALPQDPTATTNNFYSFACSASEKRFEVDARLESEKYTIIDNKGLNDGGDNVDYFESGTKLDL